MKDNSNKRLFREIRELELKALEAGILEKSEIKTSEEMREKAWRSYLLDRKEWLAATIKRREKRLAEETGGAE